MSTNGASLKEPVKTAHASAVQLTLFLQLLLAASATSAYLMSLTLCQDAD